jgi:hypothetical protein
VLVHPVVDDAADAERLEVLERVPVVPVICPAEQDLALSENNFDITKTELQHASAETVKRRRKVGRALYNIALDRNL